MSTNDILESYILLKRAISQLRVLQSKDLPLGIVQLAVLYRLLQKPTKVSDLIHYANTDKATMTRTLRSLEKMGVIRKRVDPEDRRAMIAELTHKGEAQAKKAEVIRNAIGKKLSQSLTVTEREHFKQLVTKIILKLEGKS